MVKGKPKGTRREHEVGKRAVNKHGAIEYVRAGASLGAADLCILFPRRAMLAQVKANRWAGTKENNELNRLADELDEHAYVVATVRIDDRKKDWRVRLHVGGARGHVEITWEELLLVTKRGVSATWKIVGLVNRTLSC